jgi:hypothetical protein
MLRMTKAEILQELAGLNHRERRDIIARLWELEELDLFTRRGPSLREKALLERKLSSFLRDSGVNSIWAEFAQILQRLDDDRKTCLLPLDCT